MSLAIPENIAGQPQAPRIVRDLLRGGMPRVRVDGGVLADWTVTAAELDSLVAAALDLKTRYVRRSIHGDFGPIAGFAIAAELRTAQLRLLIDTETESDPDASRAFASIYARLLLANNENIDRVQFPYSITPDTGQFGLIEGHSDRQLTLEDLAHRPRSARRLG